MDGDPKFKGSLFNLDTGSSSNRLRMSGSVCSHAIPIWKKKLSEVLRSKIAIL